MRCSSCLRGTSRAASAAIMWMASPFRATKTGSRTSSSRFTGLSSWLTSAIQPPCAQPSLPRVTASSPQAFSRLRRWRRSTLFALAAIDSPGLEQLCARRLQKAGGEGSSSPQLLSREAPSPSHEQLGVQSARRIRACHTGNENNRGRYAHRHQALKRVGWLNLTTHRSPRFRALVSPLCLWLSVDGEAAWGCGLNATIILLTSDAYDNL
mmetsp:Transcript_10785/g.29263  ORF Transcript_10785/g.29263 Transcript_10785/m.29263 type:complete len:210 (+) Transcript_10785:1884-2513(+)